MIIFLLIFFVCLTIAETFLIIKLSKKLFEFDSMIEFISETLFIYSSDLRNTLSSGILQDNPDVMNFHKRNMRALSDIESIVKNLGKPKPKNDEPKGNKPVWE